MTVKRFQDWEPMKTSNIVPKLRFPEFSGEWEIKELGEIAVEITKRAKDKKYLLLSVTAGQGLIPQVEKFGKEIAGNSYKNYFVINKFDFAYNKSSTKQYPQGYIAMLKDYDEAALPNSIFVCFSIDKDYFVPQFLDQLFQINYHGKWLKKFIEVGARAHGALSFDTRHLFELPLALPNYAEQQKIADCLASLDELLDLEEKKLSALQKYKKGLLQKLFPQGESRVPEWRFPEFQNRGEWEEKMIKDVLCYEQPTNYIVEEMHSQGIGTPVLTANKSFILGYTNEKNNIYNNVPVIIFDDFTTDKKYVIFSFKVKSSAIKILKSIGNNNLKFIFELLQLKNFSADEHKRYYISVYQFLKILIPNLQEQQKIADFLSGVDELIEKQRQKIEQLKQHKKGLLQGLFPNINGVGDVN